MAEPILSIRDLKTYFPVAGRRDAVVRAVDGIDLDLYKGEILGLVGESGSGKSTLAYSVMGMYKNTTGRVIYKGEEIRLTGKRRPKHFKKDLQLVFQDPGSSLNPAQTVGEILSLPLAVHNIVPKAQRADYVAELLRSIELSPAYQYKLPSAMGGGQRQRVSIARALACEPEIMLLDEPTSALDVSVQAKIIQMLLTLQKQRDLTYLFITHDLSLMRNIADRVAILYLGRICELAPTADFFRAPRHPYTQMLLSSIPVVTAAEEAVKPRNVEIVGEVPSPVDVPSGCAFRVRCPYATERCAAEVPPLREAAPGHLVRCVRESEL